MQDPTSYIAPGRSILTRALGAGGVGIGADVAGQGLDIGSGVVDRFNPVQAGLSALAPMALSVGGDLLGRLGGRQAAAPVEVGLPAQPPAAPAPLGPVRARGPSPFDYVAYEQANPMARPFEATPSLPEPRTYEEAVDQVQGLRQALADADRDVRLSTSTLHPSRAGLRATDRRAQLERQLAAATEAMQRLRPPPPERQNPPGTSEAARAYLERLGMGRVAELGSTRAPD